MDKEFFMNRLRELGYVGPTSFIDALIQEAAAEQVRKDAALHNREWLRHVGAKHSTEKQEAVVGYMNAILAQLPPTKTEV